MKNLESNFTVIERKIGYSFKNKQLLEQAFTRRSYSSEHYEAGDNEVLEFIGDSILGMFVVKKLIAHYGYQSNVVFPQSSFDKAKECFNCELNEAELSNMKIELVQRGALAKATERLELEQHLRMGKGDITSNVQKEQSVKEDLLEAIIGAVAIDSSWDMEVLEQLVNELLDLDTRLEIGAEDEPDYTQCLENWYKKNGESFFYQEERPLNHNLLYGYSVNLGFRMLNRQIYGYGKTESGAKRMVAKRALQFIENLDDRADIIIKTVGNPNQNRAINQLQELFQKKIIPEPHYEFAKRELASNGNPQWECTCTIEGLVEDNGGYICSSKNEAKKQAAFDTLNYLCGLDFTQVFIEYEKKIKEGT